MPPWSAMYLVQAYFWQISKTRSLIFLQNPPEICLHDNLSNKASKKATELTKVATER